MPDSDFNELVTARLNPAQINRLRKALHEPRISEVLRKGLDALEAQVKKEAFSLPANSFNLPPKRVCRTGRVPITVRVDETILTGLCGALKMTNTQVVERALEMLYDQEVYSKLPKLQQEEQ